MLVDSTAIRALGAELGDQGGALRDLAAALAARAEDTGWLGHAGDAMRATVVAHAALLDHAASLHDTASTTLLAHAEAVDRVRAAIAAAEAALGDLVAAARTRIATVLALVGGVVDPLDHVLDRFVAPTTGSLAWLDVRLPGIDLPGWPDLSDLTDRADRPRRSTPDGSAPDGPDPAGAGAPAQIWVAV